MKKEPIKDGRDSAMSAIEGAVRLFIEEINTVCLAEQIELAGMGNWKKDANAQLEKADALMGAGWDMLLGIGYSDRNIAAIRHHTHATFGKRMGWDCERPLCVLGRAYSIINS